MKKKLSITTILFVLVFSVSFAQTKTIPVVRTSQSKILFYNGGSKDDFNIHGKFPPSFNYSLPVAKGGTTCYIVSEKDSLAIFIQPGKSTRFYLVQETTQDSMLCDFKGVVAVQAATFTETYKKANQGKIAIQIPEVYELVNIVFALTKHAQHDENIVNKHTPYFQSVQQTFGAYRNHPAVFRMDSLLNQGQYSLLKMDSYAFVFEGNRIVNGGIYDRVSWGAENTLLTHVPLLEAFASKTNFRGFYTKNSAYYQSLRKDMEGRIKLSEMKLWLEQHFPSTHYDFVNVIFSPLVSWNQSVNWFSDNGFKEAQLHINALHPVERSKAVPENVVNAELSQIAFTELNHAYINPEAEKYSHALNTFKDLPKWVAGKSSVDYKDPFLCFAEYLNWSLVSLYFLDHYSAEEFKILEKGLENTMVTHRGFTKFKEFNGELLRLYKERKPGTTVSELFTPLLTWAEKQ